MKLDFCVLRSGSEEHPNDVRVCNEVETLPVDRMICPTGPVAVYRSCKLRWIKRSQDFVVNWSKLKPLVRIRRLSEGLIGHSVVKKVGPTVIGGQEWRRLNLLSWPADRS